MPWFIVQSARKTLEIYLIEAKDENTAASSIGAAGCRYLGYFDGESTGVGVVGPFDSPGTALEDDSSYSQGR